MQYWVAYRILGEQGNRSGLPVRDLPLPPPPEHPTRPDCLKYAAARANLPYCGGGGLYCFSSFFPVSRGCLPGSASVGQPAERTPPGCLDPWVGPESSFQGTSRSSSSKKVGGERTLNIFYSRNGGQRIRNQLWMEKCNNHGSNRILICGGGGRMAQLTNLRMVFKSLP